MAQRRLEMEWLDSLPADHPAARRSRRDLVLLNFLMGNLRWICRSISRHVPPSTEIVELGAGDGRLAHRVARHNHTVTALDLSPPPSQLPANLQWTVGDFFQHLPSHPAPVVIGNLILHHFPPEELQKLGRLLTPRTHLLFVEPLRHHLPLVFSRFAHPFLGCVTRHDMPVSIRAGFLPGELAPALGLGSAWQIHESTGLLGSLRFFAWKK